MFGKFRTTTAPTVMGFGYGFAGGFNVRHRDTIDGYFLCKRACVCVCGYTTLSLFDLFDSVCQRKIGKNNTSTTTIPFTLPTTPSLSQFDRFVIVPSEKTTNSNSNNNHTQKKSKSSSPALEHNLFHLLRELFSAKQQHDCRSFRCFFSLSLH